MKVAQKVIFLLEDPEGFGAAIFDALQPNPNSNLKTLEEPFDLSLESYGIKNDKASGKILHFVDSSGLYQVSILLLKNYERPVLACAINEVLASVAGENSSTMPTVVSPFIVVASKLKLESRSSMMSNEVSVYGLHTGAETDISKAMATKVQKPPSSLQIYHEQLACFLQLVRAFKVPTFLFIGQTGLSRSHKASEEGLQVIHEIGELLGSISSLSFSREKISWNPIKTPKGNEEPWRALYG